MEALGASLLDWAHAHAGWAPLVAFAVAFIESVPLLGILLPGSALLIGLGLLAGAGAFPPGPVLLAAIAGAVLGDALGFWFARAVGPRLVRRHLPRGQRRFYARIVVLSRRWGGWTIFVARFVSPMRAVAPLVAGATRMPQWHFQAANIGSALIWAPALLVPGAIAGHLAALLDGRPWMVLPLGLALLAVWFGLRAALRRFRPGFAARP